MDCKMDTDCNVKHQSPFEYFRNGPEETIVKKDELLISVSESGKKTITNESHQHEGTDEEKSAIKITHHYTRVPVSVNHNYEEKYKMPPNEKYIVGNPPQKSIKSINCGPKNIRTLVVQLKDILTQNQNESVMNDSTLPSVSSKYTDCSVESKTLDSDLCKKHEESVHIHTSGGEAVMVNPPKYIHAVKDTEDKEDCSHEWKSNDDHKIDPDMDEVDEAEAMEQKEHRQLSPHLSFAVEEMNLDEIDPCFNENTAENTGVVFIADYDWPESALILDEVNLSQPVFNEQEIDNFNNFLETLMNEETETQDLIDLYASDFYLKSSDSDTTFTDGVESNNSKIR